MRNHIAFPSGAMHANEIVKGWRLFKRSLILLSSSLAVGLVTVSPLPADTLSYTINACIDGRDLLIIRGDTLQWHHLDFAVCGSQAAPTTISSTLNGSSVLNNYQWFPSWPLPPPNEIRFEACSSVFSGLTPVLPEMGNLALTLTQIAGRGTLETFQYPTAANGNYPNHRFQR
jgi:hypothetical protein